MRTRICRSALTGLAGVLVLGALPGVASSVRPMSLATLSDHAAQVVIAEVGDVQSRWTDAPRTIVSDITLEDVTYLKGQWKDAPRSFRLTVPGGTVDETTLRVGCAPRLEVGQRWVLFLLPEYRTYPTVGIDQGALRVKTDAAGVERVYTADGHGVTAAELRGLITAVGCGSGQHHGCEHGPTPRSTRGVRVRTERTVGSAEALTLDAFVEQVKPVLDASRAHSLERPAGRRVPVTYRAVPLVGRPGAATSSSRLKQARERVERVVESTREVEDRP